MDQHTYSFPKVTPADPHELRENVRASRRESADRADERRRDDARRSGSDAPRR
ncbi:hypothetical protein ACVU7I_15735 [Patulibacter sp. S7RM1-6]